MLKRLISRRSGMGGAAQAGEAAREGDDPQLDRYIAASLSDEALAWAVGTWRSGIGDGVIGVDSCDITWWR